MDEYIMKLKNVISMLNGKYQWHMAESCTYHLPSPSCSTGVISRGLTPNKYLRVFPVDKSEEWTISIKMTR